MQYRSRQADMAKMLRNLGPKAEREGAALRKRLVLRLALRRSRVARQKVG